MMNSCGVNGACLRVQFNTGVTTSILPLSEKKITYHTSAARDNELRHDRRRFGVRILHINLGQRSVTRICT
jgi:hypothetical protein